MDFPLFNQEPPAETKPWAERLRPENWDEFLGQELLRSTIQNFISQKHLPHLLFHGPPGSGKSTLARILKRAIPGFWEEAHGADLTAQFVRKFTEESRLRLNMSQQKSFLIVDEIHRLNKAQQDHLLEPLELGIFTLVATTTENPRFVLNGALLSRIRLFEFKALSEEDAGRILRRALEKLLGPQPLENVLSAELEKEMMKVSRGDARRLIADLQDLVTLYQVRQRQLQVEDYAELRSSSTSLSLSEEDYYSMLSAFIKSIRGSDPDAALLWLAYLIRGGIDPRMVARRLVISASEDIGNADPQALSVAVDAAHAVEVVGLPEVGIVLSQATIYLSCAPKSNSAYKSYQRALEAVDRQGLKAVPKHLTTAGKREYKNPHSTSHGFSQQAYRPPEQAGDAIYVPTLRGREKKLVEYLEWIRNEKRPTIEGDADQTLTEKPSQESSPEL